MLLGIIQKYCNSEMFSHCLLHLFVNAGMDVFVAGLFQSMVN